MVEHYSWTKVTTSVQNIIVGKLYLDHYGDMIIKNHRTGDMCVVTFKQRGWGGKGAYEIDGKVVDGQGKHLWNIVGHWNNSLMATYAGEEPLRAASPTSEKDSDSINDTIKALVLWKCSPRPEHPRAFNLTEFAVTLNDLPESLKPCLPPTDCRLRPDQRAMERGEWDKASQEKAKLEEEQRERRRQRQENGTEWKPRWFTQEVDPDTREKYWKFTYEYWKEREDGKWPGVLKLF